MKDGADKNASPTSVMARLKNQARELGVPADQLAHRYVFERFLVRLSQTPEWKSRMVLMGAMALTGLTKDFRRTTTDLDMWAIDPLTAEEAVAMFKAVAASPTPDADPIVFDVDGLKIQTIREASDDPGHQLVCTAKLGQTNVKFKLEITHHANVAPAPIAMDYPTVFADGASPRVIAYHPATMLSEKFHAMVRFGDRSTRMKDFYDVQSIMRDIELTGPDIVAAFRTTFANWEMELPDPAERLPVFADDFADNGERMWRSWADDKFRADKRYEPQPFSEVTARIEPFLMHCLAMARGDKDAHDWTDGRWSGPAPEAAPAPSMAMAM